MPENGEIVAVEGAKASGPGVVDISTRGIIDVLSEPGAANCFLKPISASSSPLLLSFFFAREWGPNCLKATFDSHNWASLVLFAFKLPCSLFVHTECLGQSLSVEAAEDVA
ncbi:hypothetical protein N619_00340, partial [Ectopseudomonas oleovorans]